MVRRIESVCLVAHLGGASPRHLHGTPGRNGQSAFLRSSSRLDGVTVEGFGMGAGQRWARGCRPAHHSHWPWETRPVRLVEIPSWEPLAGLQGWCELSAHCDASPFTWPSFCLPWWHELARGRLVSIGVEDSGVLVGLALVYDRASDIGRPALRFLGSGDTTYQQLLIADDRHDVAALLWERLLSSDRQVELASIPSDIARTYLASAPSSLALVEHRTVDFVNAPLEGITL